MLRSYLFISITADATIFEMHRLVRFAMQRWFKTDNSFEHWGLQSIRTLEDAFPPGHSENRKKCQSLFPRAMMAFQTKLYSKEAIVRQASLLLYSGLHASEMGAYVDAEKMTEKSMRDRHQLLGDEHPSTITSKANLAMMYWNQGRWDEAEKVGLEVVDTSKRVLGDEHPSTITHKANLAHTMQALGQDALALLLMRQSAEASLQVLGITHPDSIDRNQTVEAWTQELNEAEKDGNSWQSDQEPSEQDSVTLHERSIM
jgi:hypothetical protein